MADLDRPHSHWQATQIRNNQVRALIPHFGEAVTNLKSLHAGIVAAYVEFDQNDWESTTATDWMRGKACEYSGLDVQESSYLWDLSFVELMMIALDSGWCYVQNPIDEDSTKSNRPYLPGHDRPRD
jgi:hypothetical protein